MTLCDLYLKGKLALSFRARRTVFMSEEKQLYGADLVVDSLINHDVDYVFGIPGAKIDRVLIFGR